MGGRGETDRKILTYSLAGEKVLTGMDNRKVKFKKKKLQRTECDLLLPIFFSGLYSEKSYEVTAHRERLFFPDGLFNLAFISVYSLPYPLRAYQGRERKAVFSENVHCKMSVESQKVTVDRFSLEN